MEPVQIFILSLGVFLGFFVQTVAGFAAPLVAFPFVLIVFPLQEAVAFLAIFMFFFSSIAIPKYWRDIDKKIVIELSVGLIIGLVLGIYLLKFGNPLFLKKGLGLFILAYVAYKYAKKRKIKMFERLGLLFGFGAGFFSGLYNEGAPVTITYLTNKVDTGRIIRGTLIGTFGVTNLFRLPFLIYTELLTKQIFIHSLYVLPSFLVAIHLGHKSYKKIPEIIFKHIIMTLLLISGILFIVT